MQAYASFDGGKEGKAKTAHDIRAIYAEATRNPMPGGKKYRENVDPSRTPLNKSWQNPRWSVDGDFVPDWRRAIDTLRKERTPEGKKIRKEGTGQNKPVLVRSLVYQASPAFFFPKIAAEGWTEDEIENSTFEERGPIDEQKLNAWFKTMVDFIHKEHGENLLSWELHLDEKSPHIHVHIVPVTNDGRLCSKELFETPKDMRIHHNKIGEAVKHLGLLPARDKDTKHNNIDPDQWHKNEAITRERLAERAEQLSTSTPTKLFTKLPPELSLSPIPEMPEKPGWFASEDEKEEYEEAMAIYEREANPKWRLREQRRLMLEYINRDEAIKGTLRAQLDEARTQTNQAKSEAREAKAQARKAEAANLREIPLLDVLKRLYPDRYHVDPRDKSIIRFDERKLGITGQKFIDNHDPKKFRGYGAIDFVTKVDNCDPKIAIAKLRDYFGTDEILRHIASVEPNVFAHAINSWPAPPEPEAPAADERRMPDVRRWMTSELCISPTTAKHLLESGQVYADKRANCIIPRLKGGAFCRGTVKLKSGEQNTYKSTHGSKKAGAARLTGSKHDSNGPVILCEGVKDGLALIDMYPAATVYIIGGSLHADVDLPQNRKILLAFDRDAVGREHAEFYRELYANAEDLLPPAGSKDWAEYWQNKNKPKPGVSLQNSDMPKPRG